MHVSFGVVDEALVVNIVFILWQRGQHVFLLVLPRLGPLQIIVGRPLMPVATVFVLKPGVYMIPEFFVLPLALLLAFMPVRTTFLSGGYCMVVDLILVVDHVLSPDQLFHNVHQLGHRVWVVIMDPVHALVIQYSKEEA